MVARDGHSVGNGPDPGETNADADDESVTRTDVAGAATCTDNAGAHPLCDTFVRNSGLAKNIIDQNNCSQTI